MSSPSFLDTNVLVYAYDSHFPKKQAIARELVKRAALGESVISTQVLTELSATLLHKATIGRTADEVTQILDVLSPIRVIPTDRELVRRAVEARARYGVHFYDGMILAAAERAGAEKIWSEDLNAGQKYFGIEVVNPFPR